MKRNLIFVLPLFVVAAFLLVYLNHGKAQAQLAAGRTVPPCTLPFDMGCLLPGGAHEDPEVFKVNNEINATFAATVSQIQHAPPADLYHQLVLLGKAELYDKNLSVNRNVACITCHMPETAYTDPISRFNNTIVALPGSVPITNVGFDNGRTFGERHPNERTSGRNPMSYTYAPFMRVLQFNTASHQFIGGNFWDMRATGVRLGNPAAEQAEGPPLNPVEMAMADEGCVVFRLSQSPYRSLFVKVFGSQVFDIHFPSDVTSVCSKPGGIPPNANSSTVYKPGDNPVILKLSPRDRGQVGATYDFFAEAIASYEASPSISAFSSKFDLVLQGKATFTASEARGFKLFNGTALCSTCHEDGVQNGAASHTTGAMPVTMTASTGRTIEGIRVGGPHVQIKFRNTIIAQSDAPLFTNQEAVNLGIPKDWQIPYLYEDKPDQFGYVANSVGRLFIDAGVSAFLLSNNNPNPVWRQFAPAFRGTFQTASLRNVDTRPFPTFVRAYMHNGYFKSLKEVVHFYNTRDVLPRCPQFISPFSRPPGEGVTCWSAPEIAANENTAIGNLHLTSAQEDDIVAFLKTLTDGFFPVQGI